MSLEWSVTSSLGILWPGTDNELSRYCGIFLGLRKAEPLKTMNSAVKNFAGALIFNPETRKVLLNKRDDKAPLNPNLWGFFGGGIEYGETPTAALARELREELMIETQSFSVQPLCSYQTHRGSQRNTFLVQTHLSKSDMVLNEGEDFDWFTINDALRLDLTQYTRRDLEYFKNYLENQ